MERLSPDTSTFQLNLSNSTLSEGIVPTGKNKLGGRVTFQEYHRKCTSVKVGRVQARLKTPNLPGKGGEQPTSRHHVTCGATKLLLGGGGGGSISFVRTDKRALPFFLPRSLSFFSS